MDDYETDIYEAEYRLWLQTEEGQLYLKQQKQAERQQRKIDAEAIAARHEQLKIASLEKSEKERAENNKKAGVKGLFLIAGLCVAFLFPVAPVHGSALSIIALAIAIVALHK